MIVAGFGFRASASVDSLRAAYDLACTGQKITALATAEDKAQSACLIALAKALSLPIHPINAEALKTAITLTQSAHALHQRGTGSVAEAAALIAAGPGARLASPRHISADRLATCAVASKGQT